MDWRRLLLLKEARSSVRIEHPPPSDEEIIAQWRAGELRVTEATEEERAAFFAALEELDKANEHVTDEMVLDALKDSLDDEQA